MPKGKRNIKKNKTKKKATGPPTQHRGEQKFHARGDERSLCKKINGQTRGDSTGLGVHPGGHTPALKKPKRGGTEKKKGRDEGREGHKRKKNERKSG